MNPLEGFLTASLLWIGALFADALGQPRWARGLLFLGILMATAATIEALPGSSGTGVVETLGRLPLDWRMDAMALWLALPAWLPAGFAVLLGHRGGRRGWFSGFSLCLLGALGVLGFQDGPAFLVAWEVLGFGAAMMLLSERSDSEGGRATFFMLALLESGALALLLAILMLGPGWQFSGYVTAWAGWGGVAGFLLALLWLAGCGAKLGLLPYYEWYPDAYGVGSGASGALFSGLLLNVAYFVLSRALIQWLGVTPWLSDLGIVVLAAGILTAVLAGLYAFQQNDWLRLLAFSSAENAGIAVAALGAALIFRGAGHNHLAALAWIVGLVQLMGHALAKGTLFFTAQAVAGDGTGSTPLRPEGLLHRAPGTVGVGALWAVLSLAALPPTAGFVSEWYLFQCLFHDFVLATAVTRIALALAGAGLALTAAIAFATFVKLFGVGLLGKPRAAPREPVPPGFRIAILVCGLSVPAFAVSLVGWLPSLGQIARPIFGFAPRLVQGWLLVPLSPGFAFISPVLLVLVWPLLALVPLSLLLVRIRRFKVRRTHLWCGGDPLAAQSGATTAFAFSNALRVFYSFVYRPRNMVQRTFGGQPYFVKELRFDYSHTPVFGQLLFKPLSKAVRSLAHQLRFLQNGQMSAYLAYLGFVLFLILIFLMVGSPIGFR